MYDLNYLLLDGARIGEEMINLKKVYSSTGRSLYLGKTKEDLEDVGPFLFSCNNSDSIVSWFLREGSGKSYGVLFRSEHGYEEIFKHCRKFLLVRTETNEELYFRYYDPRVLRIFLPTCDENQLKDFFGPIDYFLAENAGTKDFTKFSLNKGTLDQEEISFDLVNSPTDKAILFDGVKVKRDITEEDSASRVQNEKKGISSSTTLPTNENTEDMKAKPRRWDDFFFNDSL